MRIIFLGFLACLAACTSLRRQAESFMEKGAYREAISTFEEALKKDPSDAEAREGLSKAQNRFLDKRLIETRMANLAGNSRLALDILLEVAQLEAKWNFFPKGKLGGTQEEEASESFRFLEKEVARASKSNRPLSALYLLTHYAPIFSGALSGSHKSLVRSAQSRGEKQCRELSRTERKDKPYFSVFVRKVCTAWGTPVVGKALDSKAKNSGLYRGVRVVSFIEGLAPTSLSALKTRLEKAFEATPWFSAGSEATLPLTLRGHFVKRQSRVPEERTHGYTEKVPYTHYETVDKEVRSGPGLKTTTVKVQEPVTRYREVPRFQVYNGWNVTQEIALLSEGTLELGRQSRDLRIEERSVRKGFEHQWNLPAIGLVPETLHLENPETWFIAQSEKLAENLRDSANEFWIREYCNPNTSEPTLLGTGETVHRCLRGNFSEPPRFANQWYEHFFGVSVVEADELLNFADI